MSKYNSSTLNGLKITTIELSKESTMHLEKISELLQGSFVSGDITLHTTVEVSNGTESQTFYYDMQSHWFENAEHGLWHDSFLCDVQDDQRIEVLK